jgi:hypothetical protein
LLEVAGRLGEQAPIIKAKEEKNRHRRFLKHAAERGLTYVAEKSFAEGDHLSNEYLRSLGADYSLKHTAISNATHMNGGISGDSIEDPFEAKYGRSNSALTPNQGFYGVRKALSLLVTSDQHRIKGRLESAACLIEFAKYFVDSLSESAGKDEEQRRIHFGSASPQVHSTIYEAIGKRALRLTDKSLELKNADLAKEMYDLAKNCHEQSQLPIEKVSVPFYNQTVVA